MAIRYQFNPAKFDLETTRTILLKALTSLPSNDFTLVCGQLRCVYSVDDTCSAELGWLGAKCKYSFTVAQLCCNGGLV